MIEQINAILGIPLALAQKTTTGEVADATSEQITGLVSSIVSQIPLWITAILVLIISFVIARLVKSAVENKMTAEGFEEEHKEIQIVAGRTANAAVLIIGITVALKIAGIDLTPIIAAGAFGMGFALQDLIMNFIAGIMILTGKHVTIGDTIKVNGTLGKVAEIQTRATVLKAFDGTRIVVPNADLFKNQVINYTANPFRRLQLINGVAYGTDLKKAMAVMLEAVKNTTGVLVEPKASIWLYEWGDYSINFKINAWVESKKGLLKVRNALMVNIGLALDNAGIDIPFPTQTIYMSKNQEDTTAKEEKLLSEKNAAPQQPIANGTAAPVASAPNLNNAQPEVSQATAANAPAWLKKATEGMGNPAPAISGTVPMGTLTVQPPDLNATPESIQPPVDQSIQVPVAEIPIPATQNQPTA